MILPLSIFSLIGSGRIVGLDPL